jgi:hypothetical protein
LKFDLYDFGPGEGGSVAAGEESMKQQKHDIGAKVHISDT